jgi:hypothetical protein
MVYSVSFRHDLFRFQNSLEAWFSTRGLDGAETVLVEKLFTSSVGGLADHVMNHCEPRASYYVLFNGGAADGRLQA